MAGAQAVHSQDSNSVDWAGRSVVEGAELMKACLKEEAEAEEVRRPAKLFEMHSGQLARLEKSLCCRWLGVVVEEFVQSDRIGMDHIHRRPPEHSRSFVAEVVEEGLELTEQALRSVPEVVSARSGALEEVEALLEAQGLRKVAVEAETVPPGSLSMEPLSPRVCEKLGEE